MQRRVQEAITKNISSAAKTETNWFDRIPKVELHLHLEGAIPHPALWELVQKYGGDPSIPNLQALAQRFEYRDFPHFIETWIWKNQFLHEYEDFSFIAEAVARDLAQQNIRYAEVFSPHLISPGMVSGRKDWPKQSGKVSPAFQMLRSHSSLTWCAILAQKKPPSLWLKLARCGTWA